LAELLGEVPHLLGLGGIERLPSVVLRVGVVEQTDVVDAARVFHVAVRLLEHLEVFRGEVAAEAVLGDGVVRVGEGEAGGSVR